MVKKAPIPPASPWTIRFCAICLDSVKKVAQKQKITSSNMEDRDIIAMVKDETDAVVQVFLYEKESLLAGTIFMFL